MVTISTVTCSSVTVSLSTVADATSYEIVFTQLHNFSNVVNTLSVSAGAIEVSFLLSQIVISAIWLQEITSLNVIYLK